jgi:Tfp pilus assembly protein PilX
MSPRPHRRRPSSPAAPRQRGVATLIVVMVLFFVVSLVAAYTNRNLIFEQRTSSNQYRATQTFETAQAGLQWAVAMLNGPRIDASCDTSVLTTDTSFRERYLTIDATSGLVTGRTKSDGSTLYAACVSNGTGWNCSCPSDAVPAPTLPTGAGVFPAFQVRFFRNPASAPPIPPGMIRVDSIACPSFDTVCLDIGNAASAEGRAVVSTLVSLQSALKTPPSSALLVRGDLDVGSAVISAYNTDVTVGAVAVQLGGTADATSRAAMALGSAPGTPASFAFVEEDTMLSGLTTAGTLLPTLGDRMFSTVFGISPASYRSQPGLSVLTGCPCTAAQVRAAASLSPMRPIWVEGDLRIDSTGDIGSVGSPVMIVAEGDITHTAAGVTIFGAIYSRAATWGTSGSGTVVGAAIAENDFGGSGSSTYLYNADVLRLLRLRYGSFVAVPGSWKDYAPL